MSTPISPGAPGLDVDADLRLLRGGDIDVEGRLVHASNATLYCRIGLDGRTEHCIYKPVAGERPLWDFPDGTLAAREVATYAVSASTGWEVVPPTVLRDGPFGPGMVQRWIDVDETVDIGALLRGDDAEPAPACALASASLRRMAVFDAVVNNADRKGGHLLPVPGGHVYGVDHGVCFSAEDKLRTVLWRWRGQRLPTDVVDTLRFLREHLDGGLGAQLDGLITDREVAATRRRLDRLLATGRHPRPGGDWPPVPWPAW
jgi:uncharacterized repeat protein (TIGR03843 family)